MRQQPQNKLQSVLSLLGVLSEADQSQAQSEAIRSRMGNENMQADQSSQLFPFQLREAETRQQFAPIEGQLAQEKLSAAQHENSPQQRAMIAKLAESKLQEPENEMRSRSMYALGSAGARDELIAYMLQNKLLPQNYMSLLESPEQKQLRDAMMQRLQQPQTR